MNLIIV